ncbi:helix-turn-helix domain-containing protein, partial [Streptomyces sp. NPDC127190]|uniref:helix-turn-helix domain-containing protein n=1 Tax=Streptomyces sp. NPDC127190 TaxID=3345387 RepID=UPI0036320A0E
MTDPAPRSAADRLLAVLAAFGHAGPALSLTEISRRAGLTLPTTHRLVGLLTAWGALERDPGGVYHIGLRLWELGALAPRGGGRRPGAGGGVLCQFVRRPKLIDKKGGGVCDGV